MEAGFMSDATSQTVYFYNRHPISCEIIFAKLRASRGHLDGLRPEELFPHDQDHYGGLAATDELAGGALVSNGSRVADFCAGLGGDGPLSGSQIWSRRHWYRIDASARLGRTGVNQTRWPSRDCADRRGQRDGCATS